MRRSPEVSRNVVAENASVTRIIPAGALASCALYASLGRTGSLLFLRKQRTRPNANANGIVNEEASRHRNDTAAADPPSLTPTDPHPPDRRPASRGRSNHSSRPDDR